MHRVWLVLLLLLGLFSASSDVVGQSETGTVDSLKAILAGDKPNEKDVMHALNELSRLYLYTNIDSSFKYCSILEEKALRFQDSMMIIFALDVKGRVELKRSQLEQSILTFERALDFTDVDPEHEMTGQIYKGLAERYAYRGDFEKAANFIDKSIRVFESKRDTISMATAQFSLGNIWITQGNYSRALAEYEAAYDLHKSLNNTIGMTYCLSNMGGCYMQLGDSEKGIACWEEAGEIFKEKGEYTNYSSTLINLGLVNQELGNDEACIKYLNEAAVLKDHVGNSENVFAIYAGLARSLLNMNQPDEALIEGKRGLALAKESGVLTTQVDAQTILYDIYAELGQYKLALDSHLEISLLKDSLHKTENAEFLIEQGLQREYDQKSLLDSLDFVKNSELQELTHLTELKAKQRTQYGLIAGVLILLVFGAGLYNRNKVNQKQKRIIAQKNQQLEESEALRTRFFTNISHELRTPLSVITGMSELIRNNPERWSDKGSALIEQNGNNLLDLVNQILELQRLEQHELQINYVQADVIPFLQKSIGMFESMATKKGLSYEVSISPKEFVMDHDPEKLLRILNNLIGNALKFTEAGGIFIRTEVEVINDKEMLSISVRDTGIGIGSTDQKKIFNRFYQADTTASAIGQGTGIGLHYVNELISLLGGNLSVESEKDIGSQFTARLPITRKALYIESPIEHHARSWTQTQNKIEAPLVEGPELLIIEDNTDLIELLIGQLSGTYQILVAENGDDGVALAKERIPDIIVSDVMMPGKDGFEVLNILKGDPLTSHIPILMLTAKADVQSKLEGLSRGADDYLSKPFHAEELRLRLHNVLEQKRRIQERYAPENDIQVSDHVDLAQEDAFILKIKEVLEANLEDSDFNVPEFCNAMHVSRTQLHNKIKALTGLSTSIYIRELRLEKAKVILQNKGITISEVAYAVGFSSPSYFTQAYSQKYGYAPSEKRG